MAMAMAMHHPHFHTNPAFCWLSVRNVPNTGSDLPLHLPSPTKAIDKTKHQLMNGAPVPVTKRRKVAVFWDLDNKPPPPKAQPYDVAVELKKVAGELGEVVDVVAYANKHAFRFVPGWVKEAREQRSVLDQMELEGVEKAEQPYVCLICDQKFPINLDLKNHLLSYHEKERQRRARLLKKLKNSPLKERQVLEAKEQLYLEASRNVLIPEVGYGLEYELKRAGICVRMVSDDPQAADRALKRRMRQTIKSKNADCLFLVSDDTDYEEVLMAARSKGMHTAVLAKTVALEKSADVMLSWFEFMSGDARIVANRAAREWIIQEKPDQKPSFEEANYGSGL
ncbi:hypothetical protein O6H91_23G060500 [Diphasiastrum complanatum]|uniref:Uncharacterized protein n=1 Tax=Diphasiastrum complanatum TaxID=34168 RepID=A0ACC2AB76_DIPCM|nr:hypothetical protein O6H91_23G060500 [Diphasiastrum complanatum]